MNVSAESLSLSITNFRTQMLTSLMRSGDEAGSSFDNILSQVQAGSGSSSSSGLDTALGVTASGYAMMTKINGLDVVYKAQYSELNAMELALPRLQAAAQRLGAMAGSVGNDGIKTRLQDFAQQYNAWVQRFSPDVQQGGVLAGTQAAEISLYELKQSIANPFIGAKDGFHGLADMGIAVDPNTGLMSVDASRFDAALASNKQGVVAAVADFGANFAKSANLLASDGNFVRNRLDNLGGAIAYIDGNAAALQKEFGSGDAANPTGQIAQALAAYNRTSRI